MDTTVMKRSALSVQKKPTNIFTFKCDIKSHKNDSRKGESMNVHAAAKLADVRSRIEEDTRISLSDFARGKTWRKKLATDEFMELQEHGERIAWIISEDGMREMLEYVADLEAQVEEASIRAMFEERKDIEDWKTGEDLKESAIAYLHEHGDMIKKAAGIE